MIGSIIGDIAGSIYEFNNIHTKDFPLFGPEATFTDDSILTVATADWLLRGGAPADYYARFATLYPCPMGGYGTRFSQWAKETNHNPYNSCGNGSAMRVGPVGWISIDPPFVMARAKESAQCTHNHPEGIKGAQVTAMAILYARLSMSKDELRKRIAQEFGYDLSMTVTELQQRYSWQGIDHKGNSEICQDSVPQAIICALEATDFEDAIRNAISIGGDSDTIGCITGSIAEPLYGIPAMLRQQAWDRLPRRFQTIIATFEALYGRA